VLDLRIILFWQFIREQRDLIPRDKEIMLELEPCGGVIIARRTVYSDRGPLVLLDWPSAEMPADISRPGSRRHRGLKRVPEGIVVVDTPTEEDTTA
jgi:hypothetical protein